MRKKKTLVLISSLVLIIALIAIPFSTACGNGEEPAPRPTELKVFELKAGNQYPALHRLTPDAFHWWGKEIEKRTNGRVTFIWFDGRSLVANTDAYEAVRDGISDVQVWEPREEDPLFRPFQVAQMPYIGTENSLQGSPAMTELMEFFPELGDSIGKDAGLVTAWVHQTDIFNIHTSNKVIKSPEDMQGQLMYTSGIMYTEIYESMGATPVSMSWGEAYSGFERGLMTGSWWPWAPLRSLGVVPILKYHTIINVSLNTWMGSINPQVWEKFPQDIKDVFIDLRLSMAALSGATLTNEASDVQREMKELGQTFYTPTAAEMQAFIDLSGQPIIDSWLADASSKGYDGQVWLDKLKADFIPKYADGAYGFDDWWGLAGRVWLLEK